MDEFLNKETTWELVQSTENRINRDSLNNGNPVIIKLEDFKKSNGQLEYSKLMKELVMHLKVVDIIGNKRSHTPII